MEEQHSYSHGLLYSIEPEFITSLHLLDHAKENASRRGSDLMIDSHSKIQTMRQMLKSLFTHE